jgi:DNA-binding GntR family transcriptional regulator
MNTTPLPQDEAAGSPSAVQRVVEVVLARIRSGEYAPGQIIVARDLMGELGLSKAPVREGIHVLVGEGVIELLPNRSARIRKLSAKDLLDFVEVWAAVGGVNLRLGAEHVGEPDSRRRIAEALEAIQRTERNRVPYDFFMAVAQLHSTLVDIHDNSYIRGTIARAHFAHFYRHIERIFPGAHWAEHLAVFKEAGDAILAGDGERAETIYRRHMRWVGDMLREKPQPERWSALVGNL